MKNLTLITIVIGLTSLVLLITAIAMMFSRVFGYGLINLLLFFITGGCAYLQYKIQDGQRAPRNLK